MESVHFETVKYYIIFTGSNMNHWIMKWLDPYFKHCYAVKKSPGGKFWIEINPKRGFTDVEIHSTEQYPTIRDLCKDAVIIETKQRVKHTHWRVWHLNCVEFVKTLLGIDNYWVWTPKQLYNHLRG